MKRILIRSNALFFALLIILLAVVLFGINTQATAYAATGESESNNTVATANTISVNTTISGNLSSSSDVDWYKFTISNNGYIDIEFNHTLLSSGSNYWTITLYDETGVNTVDGSDSYFRVVGNANGKSNRFGLSSGTYYVKISPYSHSGNDYNFIVNYTSSSDWETEKNNSMETADSISVNKTYNGSISSGGDVDWYKFTISNNGYIDIEFNHTLLSSGSNYWTITLYDETGVNTVDGSDSYFRVVGNANGKSNRFGLSSGTYYVKISPYSHSGNDYNFIVNYTSSSDWETEKNNSMETADSISVNKTYNGSISSGGDVDWYKFTISSGCKIAITFNHEKLSSSSKYWTIYLYDSTAVTQLLEFGRKGDTETATSEYKDVIAGTYYLKVAPYSYSGVDYSLRIIEYHDHTGQWVEKVVPTCTTAGSEERICTICGNVETRDVAALGHDYGEGVHTKDATIIHTGEITYTCSRCGDSYIEKDKSKVWILPVIIVGAVVVLFGVINYIRMMKKKS